MDDLKLYGKSEEQIDSLVRMVSGEARGHACHAKQDQKSPELDFLMKHFYQEKILQLLLT